MRRKPIYFFFLLLSIHAAHAAKPKAGIYRAELVLHEKENVTLPFSFDLYYKKKKAMIVVKNAEERIFTEDIRFRGDSMYFRLPVFDTEFRCRIAGDSLLGVWINHYRKEKNVLRFRAVHGDTRRFPFTPGKANPVFEGKWKVTFSPAKSDSSAAIGIFHHLEQTDFVNGTFLTETGDYRFLEGMKQGNKLYLSCFDGSHAFLFIAELKDGSEQLEGVFYSGAHWQEKWVAQRDENFRLREADEITKVKDPSATIDFKWPDLDGKIVSLSDSRFKNKPVIIQVMGSWCPNCMDESAYLSELYRQYQKEGLEIIALAFEKTSDEQKARQQVSRLVKRFDITYPVLLTLQSGKEKASQSLPFLSSISAFPTTIFLNRRHQVVKIHSGFSGPATGNDYLRFKENTEQLVKQLLKD